MAAACLVLFGVGVLLALPSHAEPELPLEVDAQRLFEIARLDENALAELRKREVVTLREVSQTKGDSNTFNLYSGLALLIDAPAPDVVAVLSRPEWAGAGIPGAIGSLIESDSAFPAAVFHSADVAEVQRILKGADEVNLSRKELEGLRALGLTEPFDQDELARFGEAYTDLLKSRYESYLQRGLDGIPPYENDGKSWSPADHIRAVNEYWDSWLPKVLPRYASDLSRAPGEIGSAIRQEHLLVRKPIGQRPIFSLVHRFGRHTGDVVAVIHREYFVGGTYGAMQIIIIGAPYEDGTLVLLGGDAFTDRVAGFGSGMKHKVGRQTMQDVMGGMMLELRAQSERAARFD